MKTSPFYFDSRIAWLVLVPSVQSSTCKKAPSVCCYYCSLCKKYTIVLIVLLSVRNTHAQCYVLMLCLYLRYLVVEIVKSVSTNSIILVIDKVLSVFVRPVVIKTDNGSPFNSRQFNKYSKHMGFIHRKITPLWPRANDQAESFNKPLMKRVRSAKLEGKNWKEEMFKFLRQYRVTPHTVISYSPFRLLFQREAKTHLLDAVVTNETRLVDKKQGRMMKRVNHTANHTRITKIGQQKNKLQLEIRFYSVLVKSLK